MARRPNVRSSFTALLSLALVLALAACGAAVDPDGLTETEQEIVGDDGSGETTYDAPPTIGGEPVTEDDLADGIPDGAVLEGDFSGWDFSGMNFSNVSLAGAKFDGALFVGTKFSGSTLRRGSFVGADFTRARLMGSDLSYGDFTRAIFTDALMPGESFQRTGATFDDARWTDGVTVCAVGSVGDCR